MLGAQYLTRMRGFLDELAERRLPEIERAAEAVADRLAAGGALHVHDTGHMLNQELVHRAGGLFAIAPLQFQLSVHNPVSPLHAARPRTASEVERTCALTDLALKSSNLAAGDVLIVGSVSGRNVQVVDVALKARQMGALVVAITSVAYSQSVESRHPSGKRLFEAADIVLDNGAEPGDACLEVEGLPVRAVPTSGIGAALVAWTLLAEVIERLIAKGRIPHVYASVNLDWGAEFNARAQAEFETEGI